MQPPETRNPAPLAGGNRAFGQAVGVHKDSGNRAGLSRKVGAIAPDRIEAAA